MTNKNLSEFFKKIKCEDKDNYIYSHLILGYLLDGVKGKKILDIGCGGDAFFPPYLCRSLFRKGADVEGIDIEYDHEKESFKAYWNTPADEALKKLTENSYDAVITSRLFSDGEFLSEYYHTMGLIISNIHRILKKGSFYVNACNLAALDPSYKQFCEKVGFNLEDTFTRKDNKYREWHIWRK